MKEDTEEKKCVICGWNKKVEAHHLQKYKDYGADIKENIVYLCPNHHWLADFGDEEDIKLLLLEIKRLTGKEPIVDIKKKSYIDKLIKISLDEQFGEQDLEYWKGSWNYECIKRYLLARPGMIEYREKYRITTELEIKYLINKLIKELELLDEHIKYSLVSKRIFSRNEEEEEEKNE